MNGGKKWKEKDTSTLAFILAIKEVWFREAVPTHRKFPRLQSLPGCLASWTSHGSTQLSYTHRALLLKVGRSSCDTLWVPEVPHGMRWKFM